MTFECQSQPRDFVSRPPRVDISFDVRVRCGDGEFEAMITNLSARGFRLRSGLPLEPGSEISLKVGKLPPVECVIRWVIGNDAGGSFVHAVAL